MFAQTDTTQETTIAVQDTVPPPVAEEPKKEKKKRDRFKVHGGITLSSLSVNTAEYESSSGLGYVLGASYERGRFFYWEIGAQLNNSVYTLIDKELPENNEFDLKVNQVGIPIRGGINVLSAVDRIVGLQFFVGAVPSFMIGVGDNDFGFDKNDIKSFNFNGQAGVAVNIAFFYIEANYNIGFGDIFENGMKSGPSQLQALLGFRF